MRRFWPMPILGVSAVIAAALIALYMVGTRRGLFDEGGTLFWLFMDKRDVPIGRLFSLAVFFVLGYGALTLAWRPVHRVAGWLLMPLGQHALPAYSLHLFALVAWGYVLPTWTVERSATWNAAIQLAALASVWLAVVAWIRFERHLPGRHPVPPSVEPTTETAPAHAA